MVQHTRIQLLQHITSLLALLVILYCTPAVAAPFEGKGGQSDEEFRQNILEFQQNMREKMRNTQRRKVQDKISGLPESVLKLQSEEPIRKLSIKEAAELAITAAAQAAAPLLDRDFHNNGKTLTVPNDFATIQQAIDAARSGDTVLVRPGTYYEQLIMKDGVKLVSDSADQGDQPVAVPDAHIKLPQRALRTILDGSHSKPSKQGMIDFDPGVGRTAIIDGFTIQNLPLQNHHTPGHAHGLNIRGASPVITNCLIRNMGSTGIGSHVVYTDQDKSMPERDFRWDNVQHQASAVLYNNIIHSSVGLGIGCNHFSSPFILGNEVFNNSDAALGDAPSPGIGNKHGSFATIIGNIVHDNPGGGILAKNGVRQGKHGIDRPTHPTIENNVVYDNGKKKPGISGQQAGSAATPIILRNNVVYRAGATGISLSRDSVGIIADNTVMDSMLPDISINGSTALQLNHNKVIGLGQAPGITIVNGAIVEEMIGNAVENGESPRFMVDQKSRVNDPASQ